MNQENTSKSAPSIQVTMTIQEITVGMNQAITVWLNKSWSSRNAVQVDLHVTPEGQPVINVDRSQVEISPFQDDKAIGGDTPLQRAFHKLDNVRLMNLRAGEDINTRHKLYEILRTLAEDLKENP